MVPNSPVSLATLRRFLLSRDFQERRLKSGHLAFEHPASGLYLLLPDLEADELVPLMNFAAIRWQLDTWGLATTEEVDRLAQKASA